MLQRLPSRAPGWPAGTAPAPRGRWLKNRRSAAEPLAAVEVLQVAGSPAARSSSLGKLMVRRVLVEKGRSKGCGSSAQSARRFKPRRPVRRAGGLRRQHGQRCDRQEMAARRGVRWKVWPWSRLNSRSPFWATSTAAAIGAAAAPALRLDRHRVGHLGSRCCRCRPNARCCRAGRRPAPCYRPAAARQRSCPCRARAAPRNWRHASVERSSRPCSPTARRGAEPAARRP